MREDEAAISQHCLLPICNKNEACKPANMGCLHGAWWPCVAQDNNPYTVDNNNMVWNGTLMSHSVLAVHLLNNQHNQKEKGHTLSDALAPALAVLTNQKHALKDMWVWKDLTAGPETVCTAVPLNNKVDVSGNHFSTPITRGS